ncbi:MAG: Chromosome segregation ATPase-like protein [Solirubrobacterales bacterium]|nr:Chromosome segregation ATPase-like protein [Solirubrobacterales bacterium]
MVPPVRHPRDPDDPDAGTIVDPTVIAERRARRAELNEGALRERAVKAEEQLSAAQRQLDGAHEQRKELAARLKRAERDLRAARQGEHAEGQRREEIEEDASAARREAEEQIAELRAALAASELRVEELEAELARHDRQPATGDLQQQLVTERQGRIRAVRALEHERERATAEVTLLQHEVDRRARVQKAVSRQLVELRAELTSTQARVSSDAQRKAAAESVLDDLGSTALRLRDDLQGLEDERAQLERQVTAARAQVAERDARLAESAERLAAAEQAAAAADDHTRAIAQQVQAERTERAQVEAQLRLSIAEERDAFQATVEQHRVTVQAAIARERATFESQMAVVRDGLVVLRERLAEAEADVDRRVQAERERCAAEHVGLRERLHELIGTAGSVKAGYERELAAIAAERDVRVAAERERFSVQLAGMEQRVGEMREHLTVAAAELSRQLEAERTARWAAEEQLKHERALVAAGRAGAGDAADVAEVTRLQALLAQAEEAGARAEDRIVELEDELEQIRVALRPPPRMPPADHPALQDLGAAGLSEAGETDSVIIDLARAAARLRTRREDAADEPAADVAREAGAVDENAGTDAAPGAARPAEVEAEDDAHGGPPARAPIAEVEIGRRAQTIGRRVPRAWLTPSIIALARQDPHAAAAVIEALVPVQAARLEQDLTYDLLIAGHPELRVHLHRDGTAVVAPRTADDPAEGVDFRLSGSAIALAPLAGGNTGRRALAGVTIAGRKRRARRLAKSLRPPVGLSGLVAAGVTLPPVQLLTLLMGAMDLAATKGERFTIAFAEDDGPATVHVVVGDGRPIVVRTGAPAHTAATVRTASGGLAGFLAGEEPARVSGDVAVVGRLLDWADAAQGLDG